MLGSNTITLEDLAGNTTTYAFTLDNIAPVGGLLTMKTNLHPDGLSVVSPDANGIYTIATPLSITGVDVFKSLSAVVTDSNLNITSVPVYIDGSTTANGEMVYDANSGVWNYENQTSRPDFGAGTHNFVATFYDLAGNATTLTARFTTDNTAPVIMYNGNTVSGNQFTPNITIDDNNSTFTWTSDPSNPAGVTFDNTLLTPQFTFTNSGTYKFTLTVTDALGNSNSQDVSFSYLAPIISAVRSLAMSPAVSSQQSTAGSNDNSASDDQGQVLGDQTTKPDTTDNSNSNNAAIKGASTTKDDTASIFGIAWYWWVVILAAAAAVIWWIITAMRRRDDQNA
jgi:hypothetical protein